MKWGLHEASFTEQATVSGTCYRIQSRLNVPRLMRSILLQTARSSKDMNHTEKGPQKWGNYYALVHSNPGPNKYQCHKIYSLPDQRSYSLVLNHKGYERLLSDSCAGPTTQHSLLRASLGFFCTSSALGRPFDDSRCTLVTPTGPSRVPAPEL